MDHMNRALTLLPPDWRQACRSACAGCAEELRLRLGRPPTALCGGREFAFSSRLCRDADLACVLERASGASFHAVAGTLRRGYLSCGGLRIGVCPPDAGEGSFPVCTSLCIRVPRECRGIAAEILPALREQAGVAALILSPPGGGKTTLLRECIRCLSEGGRRMAVVDERGELSGSADGTGGFDLGHCSYVLVGAPKAACSLQLLRTMNPQMIAMDEITDEEDLEAVRQIAGCGVGILATLHSADPEQMKRRALYRRLLEEQIFSLALSIHGAGDARRITLRRLSA